MLVNIAKTSTTIVQSEKLIFYANTFNKLSNSNATSVFLDIVNIKQSS